VNRITEAVVEKNIFLKLNFFKMKYTKFIITAIVAVLFLSITNTNAQNFRMDYQLNLQSVTEVAISDDGSTGFLAVVSGINSSGDEIIMLVKLDAQLNVVWTKSLDYSAQSMNLRAFDVKRDPAGGYAICGRYFNTWFGYYGGYLMSIDNNGNMLWTLDAREINNTDRCEELRSVEIVGNHYVCCGYCVDQLFYPKNGFIWSVDKNTHIVEWTRTETSGGGGVGTNPNPVTLNDIAYNPYDGLLYTCGTWYDINGTTPKEFVLASYDLNGNNVTSHKYTDLNSNSMVGKALAFDNQYIYVTGNVDMGGSDDIFMAKFLPNGTEVGNRRLDVISGDKVEDIVYFQNQLFYTGYTNLQNRDGLLMQTWDNGLPIFSALYYGIQTPKFEFHKMLYRITYTTPSIIKIGMHGTTNTFTIVETFIPNQADCYMQHHIIQPYSLLLARTFVNVYHTKIDFDIFHIVFPVSEQVQLYPVCDNPFYSTGPIHDKNTILHTTNAMQENSDQIRVEDNKISLALSYQNAAYKLYSMDGRCIASGTVAKNCNIDISSYTKGIYLLHLQSANKGVKTIKIIK